MVKTLACHAREEGIVTPTGRHIVGNKMHGLIFNLTNPKNFIRSPGAHRIATHLRSLGWDIEVIDYANFFSYEILESFFKSRVSNKTKFVGFSSMFSLWNDRLEQLVTHIKQNHSDIITILGGQVPQSIKSRVDYYVIGFGENAITAVLEHHFGNATHSLTLDDEWLKDGRNVIRHTSYPSAPMKSLMIRYEDRDYIESDEWLTVEFSRGCIFQCRFCSFPILGVKTDYSREVDDLEIQLKDAYDRFGVSHYYVADETFNDSSAKLKKFLPAFKSFNFNPYLAGFIRADLLVSNSRKQDLDMLLEMNFLTQFYGIETLTPTTAKMIGKSDPSVILPKLLDVSKIFQHDGKYRGEISMIVGLPFETKQEILNGYKWLKENWNDQALVYYTLTLYNDSKYNKVNDIALDPQKYGYELLNRVQIKRHEDSENFYAVNWKNDNFTFDKAALFTNSLTNKLIEDKFKVGMLDISRYSRYYNNDIRRAMVDDRSIKLPNEYFINKIVKYKEKKLSV